MTDRIGILGGTFDPPHIGHLVLAEQARDQLALDVVMWVIAGHPPHKLTDPLTPVVHRLKMLQLALKDANNPAFQLSSVDVDRPGPHYSADTIDILTARQPDALWFFLIGGDSLRDLAAWHQPQRIIAKARLAVMNRPRVEYDMSSLERAIPGLTTRLDTITAPLVDVAACSLRQHIQSGRSIRYLVPDSVADYIASHHLYQLLQNAG